MPCFHAIYAYPPPPGAPNKRFVFSAKASYAGAVPILVPCGKCIGCRLAKAQDWSTRCVHELKYHSASSFLTLTYSNEHLPDDMSVSIRTFQLFMKRLRKESGELKLRYFASGENGDRTHRPHYHAILFGEDFSSDRYLWKRNKDGHNLYRSPRLERIWGLGEVQIGAVTAQSAGYVARYTVKKLGGQAAADRYVTTHPLTGEVVRYAPPFLLMSRKPGLGAKWFEDFKGDAFPSDFVIVDGVKKPVPGYYIAKLLEEERRRLDQVRRVAEAKRRVNGRPEGITDAEWERLLVREEVLYRRASGLLSRDVGNGA